MILAEMQFSWFIARLNFLGFHLGRGIFYLFVGSLTFAVFGLDGILSIFLMIVGIIVMICGVTQVVFQFFGHKFAPVESASTLPTVIQPYSPKSVDSDYSAVSPKEPSFDPNAYVGSGIDLGKPNPDYGNSAPAPVAPFVPAFEQV